MSMKNILEIVGIILFSIIIGFVIVEVCVRILHLGEDRFYRPHELFGYFHIPNKVGWSVNEGGKSKIKINSKGLRDKEYSYEKKEGTFRILVLGDSYAEAFQVKLKDAFHKVLEVLLNQYRVHQKVEVINAGVSGYGTDNELLFFRHEGYKYHPDLVLLTFVMNDVKENSYKLEKAYEGEVKEPFFILNNGKLELKNFPFKGGKVEFLKDFLRENFHTYHFLYKTFKKKKVRKRFQIEHFGVPLPYSIYESQYTSDWEDAWKITKALILQLKKEVEEHDAKLVVAIISSAIQLHEEYRQKIIETYPKMKEKEWDWDKPNRILTDFLLEQEIPYIDLLSEFQKHLKQKDEYLHFPVDGHWNIKGHHLAGERLCKFFMNM